MSDESVPESTPSPRCRHRTLAEAQSLVAQWRASGLTQQAFCRSRGMLRSTLDSCRRRTGDRSPKKRVLGDAATPDFVQVVSPSADCAVADGKDDGLVMHTADGIRLQVTAAWQIALVTPALDAIREATR